MGWVWMWRGARMLGLLVFTLMLSTGGAAPWSGAVLKFVPLIVEAPDEPQVVTGTNACTTPPPVFKSALNHCYTPSDIYAAYGVDTVHASGITGSGQTIVIVDSYGSPTAREDLHTFSKTFGLPDADLTIINPDGAPPFNGTPLKGAEIGWAEETSLDLQWAHAIAPDARIVLIATIPAETEDVQGFPNMLKGEEMAASLFPGASMSQSFAATEQSFHDAGPAQVARFNETYQVARANKVTVFGSSGDFGTANTDKQGRLFPFPTVNWPSSDPLVTSAGGTWLQFGWLWNPITGVTDRSFINPVGCTSAVCAEAVWKEDWRGVATGGGRSVLFSTPGFQSGISQTILMGSRGIPDLSWNAAVDGGVLVFTSFPGLRVGWHIVGGTSASSPQLAAVIALANQKRHNMGKESIGYLNPVLYGLPDGDFRDIVPLTFGGISPSNFTTTLDNNADFGTTIPGLPTLIGYDLTTGRGSPKVPQFVDDLAAAP